MAGEYDDFDDPQMTDLLQRWGRQVGDTSEGRALFKAPGDWSAMQESLHEVDDALARKPNILRIGRAPWLRRGLALAAAVVLLVGGAWFIRGVGGPDAEQFVVQNLQASGDALLLRDADEAFRSGDALYLHLDLNRPAVAGVAMLDSLMQLDLLSGAEQLEVTPGHNALGPFVLDDNPGTESFIILLREPAADHVDFRSIIQTISDREPEGLPHVQRLEQILSALKSTGDLTVAAISINHLPKE